jgi:hypothetical protein
MAIWLCRAICVWLTTSTISCYDVISAATRDRRLRLLAAWLQLH